MGCMGCWPGDSGLPRLLGNSVLIGVTGSLTRGSLVFIDGRIEVDGAEVEAGRLEEDERMVLEIVDADAVIDELSRGSCIDVDSGKAKSFRIGAGEIVGGEEVEGPAVGGGTDVGGGGGEGCTWRGKDCMTR